MSDKIRDEKLDYLFKAILTLENQEECYGFQDLCTVSECWRCQSAFTPQSC